MTGVEILAAEEVVTAYGWSWSAYLIALAIAVVFCGFVGFTSGVPYDMWKCAFIGIGVGLVVGALIGVIPAKITLPSEYETHYKLTISDEVSMNDFLSKYEIIDQEGRIYEVREIND